MPEPTRVLVRVDAGLGVGHGHLARCLALTQALTARGALVTVATRARDRSVLRRIADAGADTILLAPIDSSEAADGPVWATERQLSDAQATFELSPIPRWDAVIVDHYRLDRRWEEVASGRTDRLVVIDDLANRPHVADVLVDHNWYGPWNAHRYDRLVSPETITLFGPRYAMLHQDYADARVSRPSAHYPPRRLLISFGGTDVGGQTHQAIEACLSFPQLQVEAVLGTFEALTPALESLSDEKQVRLHIALPSLVGLLSEVDLVIGAGGTATWERLCMGLRSIVTTVTENQSGVTQAFHNAGLTRWLGTADQVTVADYRRALQEFMIDEPRPLLPLVDGHGAYRVSLAAFPPDRSTLTVRPATELDAPSVITAGPHGNGGPDHWAAALDRLRHQLKAGTQPNLFVHNGIPVGIDDMWLGHGKIWLEDCLIESPREDTQ